MQFFLFLLANALLFIRPSELIPGMGDVELYRYAIAACLAVSLPVVLHQLFIRTPGVPPIAGCVLAIVPAAVLSNVANGQADAALDNGIEFVKVLVYFLLLLGLITDTARLKQYLRWVCVFTAGLAIISTLRYHADAEAPVPAAREKTDSKLNGTFVVDKVADARTGELADVRRMCGTGIFNDPNDLALALVVVVPVCLFRLTDPTARAARPLWIGLLLLLGYALTLTQSRGGFLALVSGLGVLFYLRHGAKKMILPAVVCLPVLLVAFAGRMTDISTSNGTGQSRIQLWEDALLVYQQSPLVGVGMDTFRTMSSHVAHNSFIHCYAELGIGGGTLFVAAFYFAARGLLSLRASIAAAADDPGAGDPELRRLYPFFVALVVSYIIGISFLSRSYVVPTYQILALATVYLRLHAAQAPVAPPDWGRFLLPRLAGIGGCFLAASYTFVRLFVN